MKAPLILASLTGLLLSSCSHHSHHKLRPAPEGHKPIFENHRVRVMEIINLPGGKIPLHNHDLSGVIIVHRTAENIIRDSTGKIVSKGTPPTGAVWAEAHGPHYSIENIDSKPMHLYRVEVK